MRNNNSYKDRIHSERVNSEKNCTTKQQNFPVSKKIYYLQWSYLSI